MTHSLRITLALITLNCGLLFGLSLPTQAQGLKTNSGSFGSGWQVGGTGGDSGGSYGAAGSAGSSSGSYGGYGGSASTGSASTGANGYSGAGGGGTNVGSSYGSYGIPSSGDTPQGTSEAPSGGSASPYAPPRSAGAGLRTQ